MRLVIIGGGNMGAAIVRGVIAHGVVRPRDLAVVEIDPAKRLSLTALGCEVLENTSHIEPDASTQIMLAVKPQVFADVVRGLRRRCACASACSFPSWRGWTATASTGAGPASRVVRCMPNVACQIGQGMTAIALVRRQGDELLARQSSTRWERPSCSKNRLCMR